MGRDGRWVGGKLQNHGGERNNRGAEGGQSREIPTQRIGADQHSPAREACLLTHPGGWGLGAEAPASEVGSQEEDRCWLKGASAPQLVGREFGKKSGTAEASRDHCFGLCEEIGRAHV